MCFCSDSSSSERSPASHSRASLCQPPSHTALPRCTLTFCTSNAPVFKCISFLFSPETNLSCHFTAGYAVSFLLLFFFLCPVILYKCWCVAELSWEQIGKIIVSDRVFTSCNFQCLAQIFKLGRKTALNHRKPLIFECGVSLSVTSPSDLTFKIPLLPLVWRQPLCFSTATMSSLEH